MNSLKQEIIHKGIAQGLASGAIVAKVLQDCPALDINELEAAIALERTRLQELLLTTFKPCFDRLLQQLPELTCSDLHWLLVLMLLEMQTDRRYRRSDFISS